MVNTAAVYKYINDQTLTYINQGYTSDEISNMIELPEALNKIWYTRQYYGTVAHNAKAVYQKFMGWYDSNPVNLNPLMPSDSAKKWVEYLGDVDKVLQMAKADFDKGEYQWVAEVTNTIVFADPTNTDARLLCADALEQLGYQAESGPWRNEYLTAAQELRHGNANFTASTKSTGDMVKALSAPMLFDYMAIVMDKQALADRDFTMNVILPDVGEQHMLRVKNGVLLVYADTLSDDADVSITCPKKRALCDPDQQSGNGCKGRQGRGQRRAADADDGEYEPVPNHRDQPLQHHRAVTASRGGPWEDRPAREKTARCFQRKSKAVCFCWKQTAFAALRLPCTPESVSQQ